MTPKVSVVMAVYNAEGFLQEAVDSVLAQTFEDFEFIIINDGSTDHSLAMLQRYTDPRIRIVDQENHGLVASLNKGIEAAKGTYIARMDADDRCEPDRFELQVRTLDRNPDVALIGGAIATMDELGNPLAPRVEFPVTHEEIWANIGRKPWVFCHPTVMFRRAAAIEVGMYHSGFAHAEDAEFFARLMSKYRAANLRDVVLNYRLRRSAISFTKAGHGRVNAELVARIIDRWEPGQPFAPNQDERLAADLALAMCGGKDSPVEIEAAYHLRLGRELLRGRQWRRAFGHYFTAAKSDPWTRMAYIGMACALIHYGGAPRQSESKIDRPRHMPPRGPNPRINAF
jgi:glycosyltransferase involved in cell wall biosynthesis